MSRFEAPQVLVDLYRDLRDRRLMPFVIVLALAIVVVPLTLSRSGGSPPAPLPASTSAVKTPEAQSAVVAKGEGLRDYHKRLKGLAETDPFKQQFEVAGLEGTQLEAIPVEGGEVSAGGGGASESPASSVSSPGSPATSSGGGSSSGGSDSSGSGSNGGKKVVTKLASYRVDVRFGPTGAVRSHRGVKVLDFLPAGSEPVVAFLGAPEDGGKALFAVTDLVTGVAGDGKCLMGALPSCGLFTLKEGKGVRLTTTTTTYRLHLNKIRKVVVN